MWTEGGKHVISRAISYDEVWPIKTQYVYQEKKLHRFLAVLIDIELSPNIYACQYA